MEYIKIETRYFFIIKKDPELFLFVKSCKGEVIAYRDYANKRGGCKIEVSRSSGTKKQKQK